MSRPLRIGVNALYLIPGGVGGTEIYLRNLLNALAEIDRVNEYVVFTNRETGADLAPAQANFVQAPQGVRASFRPARIAWEQIVLPFKLSGIDVLFNAGFTTPIICPCPSVTIFQDLQHKRHPEHFRWFDLPFWRFLLWAAAHRSSRLIAASQATRVDLLRYYRIDAEKIHVIGHGVESRFFEIARERRPEPFLLCVSTLHPHKHLDRLIRAFAGFREAHPEFTLVLAGLRGFHSRPLEALVEQLRLGKAVRFTGWIPREELYDLFARAHAFIYPSTFEGFGLPVPEALAAGIPTACSAIEPLKTIAGDAAVLFDPLDEGALRQAMEAVSFDEILRERLAEAGPRRAALFSWRASAEATLAVLSQL